jgi:hypothetical protein
MRFGNANLAYRLHIAASGQTMPLAHAARSVNQVENPAIEGMIFPEEVCLPRVHYRLTTLNGPVQIFRLLIILKVFCDHRSLSFGLARFFRASTVGD